MYNEKNQDITTNPQYLTLRQKATAYCATAEHCEAEVRDKLVTWGAEDEEIISAILTYLEDNKFLSVARYCQAYTHDKLLYQGWGKRKIEMMLRQKHLPQLAILEALNAIDDEQYEQVLRQLLKKKARSLKEETGNTFQLKLLRYAVSRGFDYESSLKIIETLSSFH